MRKTVLMCLSVLTACGGRENSPAADAANGASPNRAPEASAGPQGTADVESINCSGVTAPTGPDIVGVSIGMSADDAYRAIACSNRALRVTMSDRGGFGLPPLPDGRRPRTMITAEGDQERITAALIGLPGQERVVTMQRSINFAQGDAPILTNLVGQLEQKYGALTHNDRQYGVWTGHSIRDANNQPVTDDLVESSCALSLSLGSLPQLQSRCGLSVYVHIRPQQGNQQLASRLAVSMSNGAYGMQQMEAVEAVARGAAEQQQSQELQNAQGRAPSL